MMTSKIFQKASVARCLLRGYKTDSRLPELTQDRYKIQRGRFSVVEDQDVNFFEQVLGKSYVLTESDDVLSYNLDFWKGLRGDSKIVLKPGSVSEISEVLKYCNERKLAVCPQGGNTGVVGGSTPAFDEIVLSLQRLNRIHDIDEMTGIAVCEAGCILENLEIKAKELGLVVPIDLGAKQSCHIGGNLSTNAGGLRVLRYGNLHGSVLGVEAVLANGDIIDLMSDFKKDNTGYHLKHLFIGSEGTLGVLTKLSILCPPAPKAVHVAYIGLQSFDAVLKTFLNAKRQLGEILSACEMMDSASIGASVDHFKLTTPLNGYPFYMLIETSGSNLEHDEEKFIQFLDDGMTKGIIADGTLTSDPGKIQHIWNIREMIPLGLLKDGYFFAYDLSLPLRNFYDIVPAMEKRVKSLATRVTGFGHLGDSNLHLNISCDQFSRELYQKIEPFVYEFTSELKGSVSAEHGIGLLKKQYLKYSKSENAIHLMKDIKKMLDPNGILNPYKIFQ